VSRTTAHPCPLESGLPNSRATASTAVADRPYCFGLTLPPKAVTLVPNANIRKPSFFIFDVNCRVYVSVMPF
jgi:hypothetical protein